MRRELGGSGKRQRHALPAPPNIMPGLLAVPHTRDFRRGSLMSRTLFSKTSEYTGRSTACPSCESPSVEYIGQLPPTDMFCDNRLAELLPASGLYHCRACALQFRFPVVDQAMLHTLYGRAKQEMWQHPFQARADWQLADRAIRAITAVGATILDVGCWDGSFLQQYRDAHAVYGVELNAEAARRAEEAGVKVVANDFGELRGHPDTYDVVTAFDVIEHVVNPRDFLATLASRVKPGGQIILSTGNTNSFFWRHMKQRYWYCSLAEHVSFLCETWIGPTAKDLNLDVSEIVLFSHRTKDWGRALLQVAAVSIHFASPRLYRAMRRTMSGRSTGTAVPQLTAAKDHMFVRLTRY